MEKFKDLFSDWLKLRGNDFEDEDDFIRAMEEIQMRRSELKVVDAELFSVWMIQEAEKGREWSSSSIRPFGKS